MTKLIVCIGLPASGKSTWAKEYISKNPTAKRLNRDELRQMIDNGKWSRDREQKIKSAERALAVIFLSHGHDVIIDDTNLSEKTRNCWKQLAEQNNAQYEEKSFLSVPVEKCIEQDTKRSTPVGKDVILRMFYDFVVPEPIVQNSIRPMAVITDLDGTLALFGKDKSPYDRDFINDKPNYPLIEILNSLHIGSVFIFSGRFDTFKEETMEWLRIHKVFYTHLFMRPADDRRSDVELKREFFQKYVADKYYVKMVFDDRPVVIRNVWHWYGLPVFKFGVEYDY